MFQISDEHALFLLADSEDPDQTVRMYNDSAHIGPKTIHGTPCQWRQKYMRTMFITRNFSVSLSIYLYFRDLIEPKLT